MLVEHSTEVSGCNPQSENIRSVFTHTSSESGLGRAKRKNEAEINHSAEKPKDPGEADGHPSEGED